MFACIYIPDFPLEALLRIEPELREQPVAVMDGRPPLMRVLATNERARQFGIANGMTQVQAQGYAPSLQVRRRSLLQEQTAHAALLDCACAISPRVHGEADDTVLLDIDGLERLFGPLSKIARELARRIGELGMEANVGVAANVESAIHAARGFAGTTVVPRGKEAERLSSLPVEVLFDARDEREHRPDNKDMLDALERWGVRTFRALALLPEIALAQRLGEAGVYLRKLARGEGSRPLVPAEAPLEFEEVVELEDAIDLLDGLMFVLNRMLEQLCTRLATRSLAAQELQLRMELDPQQDVQLQQPASSSEHQDHSSHGIPSGNAGLFRRGSTPSGADYEKHSAFSTWRSDHPHTSHGRRVARAGFQSKITNQQSEIENSVPACVRGESSVSDHSLKFPVPMLDTKVFLKLLHLELMARPPQAPVKKIWLRAEPARPRATQGGLFLPEAPEPERLEVTLARISSVVQPPRRGTTPADADAEKRSAVSGQESDNGRSPLTQQVTDGTAFIGNQKSEIACAALPQSRDEFRLGVAEVLDTHRPDAFRMKRFVTQQPAVRTNENRTTDRRGLTRLSNQKSTIKNHKLKTDQRAASESVWGGTLALRRFRPPIAASVLVEGGIPVRLDGGEDHAGDIVWVSGPWRSSGEWWSEQQWARDTWDVAVAGATVTVCRIYRECDEWWMEGTYD